MKLDPYVILDFERVDGYLLKISKDTYLGVARSFFDSPKLFRNLCVVKITFMIKCLFEVCISQFESWLTLPEYDLGLYPVDTGRKIEQKLKLNVTW